MDTKARLHPPFLSIIIPFSVSDPVLVPIPLPNPIPVSATVLVSVPAPILVPVWRSSLHFHPRFGPCLIPAPVPVPVLRSFSCLIPRSGFRSVSVPITVSAPTADTDPDSVFVSVPNPRLRSRPRSCSLLPVIWTRVPARYNARVHAPGFACVE